MVRIHAIAFLTVLILATPLWAGYYDSYGHHGSYGGAGYHGGGCGGGGGGYGYHHGYMHDGDDGYYSSTAAEYRGGDRTGSRYYSEPEEYDSRYPGTPHH